MKKIIFLIIAMTSRSIFAQDISRHEMHQFTHMQITNPAAVIAAMDSFASSDCGKKYPADVGLMQEVINGAKQSTHFFIVSYEKISDFQKARDLTATCPAEAKFYADILKSGSTIITDYTIVPVVEKKDWYMDTVFMKYDMQLSLADEAAYTKAWSELMDNNVEAGFVKSSYGLNRVNFGSDALSHFVYIGGSSIEDVNPDLTSTKAYAKFAKKVSGMREVVNTSLIMPVKSWPKQ